MRIPINLLRDLTQPVIFLYGVGAVGGLGIDFKVEKRDE
jgi:hypothetical protein